MNKVLVIYPALFNCYEKFKRKVVRVIQNLDAPCLIVTGDHNHLISKISQELSLDFECLPTFEKALEIISHAIVFDDGEEFVEEVKALKKEGVPLRIIRIAITRVINIKKETEYQNYKSTPTYEYIGRGAYWGNPHSMYEEGDDREEVIRKYKYDFDFDKFPHIDKAEVFKLAGKRLGCFCKPAVCHGDVLADFLNSWDDGK